MKTKHLLILLIIIALSLALTACAGGARTASSWPGLTLDDEAETAYLTYNTQVYAVSLLNGSEKWRFPEKEDNKTTFYAPSALTEDGQMVVGSYDKLFYSLNPENGVQNWTFDGSDNLYVAGPLADGEHIFAPSSDDNLYALDLNGNQRWKVETGHALWTRPTADENYVYQPSMDHHLYKLDKETGEVVWKTEDLGGAVVSEPTLSPDGVLYVGTFGSELLALKAEDGRPAWDTPYTAEGWVWAGPLLVDGVLYFGDLEGYIHAVKAEDGSQIWKIQPDDSDKRMITGKPALLNDTLYIAAKSGNLFALDPSNGVIRWSKTFDGELNADLAATEDLILLAPIKTDPILIALEPNGNQKWQFIPAKK